MLAQEVAHTYAQALFLSVRERKMADVAFEQLSALNRLIADGEGKRMLQFLVAPHVTDGHKDALVRSVFGGRLDPLFTEFLLVLMHKHRIGYLRDILDEFIRLIERERGVAHVEVTSAVALDPAQREKLTSQLRAKTGKQVRLDEKVDPSILGGVILMLDDKIIDGSIRHELNMLRERLDKVKVA